MRKFKLLFTLISMMLVGTGGLFAQPANDLCTNATTFVDGDVFTVNTTTATATGNPGTCVTFLGGTEAGVWYTISGVDGIVSANTCGAGTTYDTKLTAWTGSCGALTCVTGNDDFCGLQSGISFQAVSTETYYVYLSGFAGQVGTAEVAFSVFSFDPDDFFSDDVGYGINGSSDSLYRIELGTGDVTGVGLLNPVPPGFLAGGEIVGNQIYFSSSADGALYAADTATAAVSTIGTPAAGNLTSLEIDPTTGTLYGINVNCGVSTSLFTIDPNTGASTLVGTNATAGCGISLSIDENGIAYVVDIVTDAVVQVDLTTFATIAVAPITDAATGTPINLNFGQNTDFDCTEGSQLLFGILFDAGIFDNRFGALDPMTGIFTELAFEDIPAFGNWGTFAIACTEVEELGDGFTVNLSAITNVNVTLDGDCMAKLTARMVLVGDFDTDDNDGEDDPAPDDLFDIVVQDSDPTNGMIIDGCGTFIWTATNNQPDSILSGFTTAWGYVNAEDKTSPMLVDSLDAPDELFCVDIDMVNINTLPSAVSRCFIQDGRSDATLNASMSPALRARLLAGGGIPDFFDGCSDVEICVNDLVSNNGPCEDLVITRVFRATDGISCTSVSGEENPTTVYSYDIVFTVPSVDSVAGVDSLAQFSCSDNFPTLPANVFGDENPAPAAGDFPFLLRSNGMQVFLSAEGFCNLGAAFQDGPRIVTCENTYKFVRTFTVIDWCDVNNIRTFTQLVKVGDFDAPTITAPTQDLNFDGVPDDGPLFFSTNTADCESFFVIPPGSAVDNCDPTPTVTAVIYPGGDTLAIGFGPFAVGQVTGAAIPRGDHLIRYFAVDNCGNVETLDVPVTIGDQTAPVAICEDGLNISIGGPIDQNGGTAQLCAVDIDRASYDDCSDIELAIVRVGLNDQPLPGQTYQECITLTCADLGIVRVSLRVTDDANEDGVFTQGIDNNNFCWLDVLVEDKTAPLCIAPVQMTFDCNDLSQDFPQDLNVAFALDPIGVSALLDARFGAATGLDNCPNPVVTGSVVDTRNSCGVGQILRSFTVTDGEGFTSPPGCTQVINVLGVNDYTIVFPGDQESDDCIQPDYNGVSFTEFGCDLITVSTTIDTFSASADECYKLRITYEVLNWCEYNTLDDAYVIPRDADNDGVLDMDTTVLHVVPNGDGPADDLAYLDRDVNRANFNTIGNLDTGDGGVVPGSDPAGYGLDGSRGAFIYHQFIKVYDDTPPTLVIVQPDSAFCSLTNACVADVELGFSIDDECSPASVNAVVDLDRFIGDGVFTLADFVSEANITSLVTNNGDGTFTINIEDVPIGRHAVRIRATDGCANTSVQLLIFEVVDCKAPTPICINGLTATLMPDGNGGGMAAIWASDFIASPSSDCSGLAGYAIYRDGEQPASIGVMNAVDTGLVLTCEDEGPLAVRIYAIDNFGQADYCLTMLLVQAFAPGVCTGGDASLAGVVSTPANDMMSGVTVNISDNGTMNNSQLTTNGVYQFAGLQIGEDYTVEPTYNPAVNLGTVTTGDLIIISRHILGLQAMTGEYQLLAGDVTQDNNINVLDIIGIRRVILGLDAAFSATNSWRFYVAGDANHAEVYTENNLSGNITGADFAAVEMGNVSDANSNFSGAAEARGVANIAIEDVMLTPGAPATVIVGASDLEGFQGTLELAAGVRINNVTVLNDQTTGVNLEAAANGLIAVSHQGGEAALVLELSATEEVNLSEVLTISDRITAAEAYRSNGEVANLAINFNTTADVAADFGLEQNTPNPFADRTQIGFRLPTAATVSLTVQDIQGRTVLVREIEAAAGYNTTELTTAQLNGATGVLTYTIVAGDQTATRKLVVLR